MAPSCLCQPCPCCRCCAGERWGKFTREEVARGQARECSCPEARRLAWEQGRQFDLMQEYIARMRWVS